MNISPEVKAYVEEKIKARGQKELDRLQAEVDKIRDARNRNQDIIDDFEDRDDSPDEQEEQKIAKKTETANLDVIRLQAEQKIATANAKQKEIELSGAITEQERIRLEIEKETRVKIAEAYAEGISKVKLPQMWMSGGSKDGAAASPIDVLISMLALEKVNSMGAAQSAVPAVGAPLTTTKTNPKAKK